MTTKFRPPLGREIPSPPIGGKARVYRDRNGLWRWSHDCATGSPTTGLLLGAGSWDAAMLVALEHVKRCCR